MPSEHPPTPASGDQEPLLVDGKRARKILGDISQKLLWSMTKAGEIPCVRMRRRVLYSPEALRDWVKRNTKGARP